jgi:hypothetical protein
MMAVHAVTAYNPDGDIILPSGVMG